MTNVFSKVLNTQTRVAELVVAKHDTTRQNIMKMSLIVINTTKRSDVVDYTTHPHGNRLDSGKSQSVGADVHVDLPTVFSTVPRDTLFEFLQAFDDAENELFGVHEDVSHGEVKDVVFVPNGSQVHHVPSVCKFMEAIVEHVVLIDCNFEDRGWRWRWRWRFLVVGVGFMTTRGHVNIVIVNIVIIRDKKVRGSGSWSRTRWGVGCNNLNGTGWSTGLGHCEGAK
jgi:hypothetical protein